MMMFFFHQAKPKIATTIIAGWLYASLLSPAFAGNQQYEDLSANVRGIMSKHLFGRNPAKNSFENLGEALDWLSTMKGRMGKWQNKVSDPLPFLQLVHYEAKRAGVDPQLVLAIIQVESSFNSFAVSSASARGMMQVMPFWVKQIGDATHNLFDMETNIRYGCTILRHYLDIEKGNLFRALGRYNGSLGRAEYPNMVLSALKKNWVYAPNAKNTETAQMTEHLITPEEPIADVTTKPYVVPTKPKTIMKDSARLRYNRHTKTLTNLQLSQVP